MATFTHVLNPVAVPPDHALFVTQEVTFNAITDAWRHSGEDVDLVTVGYREDRDVAPSSFRRLPDLDHSVIDAATFALERRLPFLADILGAVYRHSASDYVIFTNADIIVSRHFYRYVARQISRGRDAFTLNRRTVSDVNDPVNNLSQLRRQWGRRHRGHDCFVFPRAYIADFDLGRTVVGVPWVGYALLFNIERCGEISILKNAHRTAHIGDDRTWSGREHRTYRDYNTREITGVFRRAFLQQPHLADRRLVRSRLDLASRQRARDDYTPPPLKPRPSTKRIFCINTGRAGSQYLQSLLATAERTAALHEPVPTMSGGALREAMEHGSPSPTLVNAKLDAIDDRACSLPPGWTYAETTHMFIKTFADGAVERWTDSVRVVHLRRNLVDTLQSFVNMGYFSDRNRAWDKWMHRVPSELSRLRVDVMYEEMDPVDRAIAYLLDIERQAAVFRTRYPHIVVVEATLESLQHPKHVDDLMSELGLAPSPETRRATGRRINERSHVKQKLNIGITTDVCRERLQRFVRNINEDERRSGWVSRVLANIS